VYCSRLAPLAYALTAPVAELYFHNLVHRFRERRQRCDHATFARHTDVADSERAWELTLGEGAEATHAVLRSFIQGDPSLPIRRDNLAEFLAWNMYNVTLAEAEADAAQAAAIDRMVLNFESVIGPLPPGRERRLTCLRYTMDPWPSRWHLPLVVYIVIGALRLLLSVFLAAHGFERREAGRLVYWHRPAPRSTRRPEPPTPRPLVFMHGVLGLVPYALLLRKVAAKHEGAVAAPIFPHCSVLLEHICGVAPPPHDSDALVADLRLMVTQVASPRASPAQPGPPAATFAAHSLGTAFLSLLVRRAPEVVAAAAFVDPICFNLSDGTVLQNFLYAEPRLAPSSWFHWLQRFVVADEPTQQDCFRRCFWWSQFFLHPSELPCDTLVCLSSRDSVASAPAVHASLSAWQRWTHLARAHGIGRPRASLEVEVHEGWYHGWLLFHPREQKRLLRRLQLMALGSRPLAPLAAGLAVDSTPSVEALVMRSRDAAGGRAGASVGGVPTVRKRRVHFAPETRGRAGHDEGDTASAGSSSDDAR
jgi:hypothetical protein